jgi:hypothetical protein
MIRPRNKAGYARIAGVRYDARHIISQQEFAMRFLVKATIPVEAGNKAIRAGMLSTKMESVLAQLKPEATYFLEEDGHRTAILILEMKDASQIPSIAEPFFLSMNAEVRFHPVMTPEDLGRAGLDELGKKWGGD